MRIGDIRFLFDFDQWATKRIMDAAIGVDDATWSAANVVDERGLGGILIHQLGAQQRWRHGLSGRPGRPGRSATRCRRRRPAHRLGGRVGRHRGLAGQPRRRRT